MFRALLRQNTLRRRTYSSIPTPTPTCAPIPHRALISITGKEVNKFLQGVIATPMPPPPHIGAGGFYSAFLSPQVRKLHARTYEVQWVNE